MDTSLSVDFGHIAHELHIPADRVKRTVELIDEGNTVPFITRYRREQTGGLDEEQIRLIAEEVKRRRQIGERKAAILKTIEAQGKLTPELQREIELAQNLKRLEDLYLPFKQKKQSLAVQAKERGLEPLASALMNGEAMDLAAAAQALVDPEKGLASAEDVLMGVGHIVAERFGDRADLRGRLRRIFFRSGRLVCSKVEKPETPEPRGEAEAISDSPRVATTSSPGESFEDSPSITADLTASEAACEGLTIAAAAETETSLPAAEIPSLMVSEPIASENLASPNIDVAGAGEADAETSETNEAAATDSAPATDGTLPTGRMFEKPEHPLPAPVAKKKKKKKKKTLTDAAFKDYYQFQEPLSKLPPHRTLAINRGERANALRVKIESDFEALAREAEDAVVPSQHPHAEFLRAAVRDALARLIVPSLEREARRELSDRAERHAVDVFVRNLRKLLLQPPVHGRRVLAIDPGFKSGCKLAAVDEWGNTLDHGMMFIIGKDERKDKARQKIADIVRKHNISVIAIGNGTACREAEAIVAELLGGDLKDLDVAYVTVNEAGASVYSTSQLGREELPGYDAILRSAVSIARRLLDPLSELVKINPANIGVGMYQHDMKAKHLKDSLDAVVESCVNYVGVDVNSASPALLRYVSGLNALTARRIYEYRREHGPFTNREQLRNVPGIGEATFVQAAGFLKILGGDNPLDATWIHPESYSVAQAVLVKFHSSVEELAAAIPAPPAPPKKELTQNFGVGLVETTSDAAPASSETAPATEAPASEASTGESTPSLAEESVSAEPIASEPIAETPDSDTSGVTETSDVVAEATVSTPIEEVAQTEEPAAEAPAKIVPKVNPIAEKLANVNVAETANELQVSELLLEDIVVSLKRPGRDPREELPPPIFRRGIMKLEDLQPGMELQGTVLNVVDFGAFVDIGLTDSGLVHISRLADRFIRDPHEVVGVGDVLKLWVTDVDRSRRRVSLTAIQPGTERPPQPKRERQPRGEQQPRGERPPRAEGDRPPGDRPPRPQGNRPPRPRGERPPGNRPPQGDGPPPVDGPPPPNREARPPQGDRPPGQGGGRPGQQGFHKGPPQFEMGRSRGGGGRGGKERSDSSRTIERPSSKPKEVKPLTKKMEEGKEALCSFSDLIQFYDKKKDKPDDKKSS